MARVTTRRRASKATLAVGYVGLLAGVLAAYADPATGYELSVYAATPAAYWIGIAVAVGAAVVVTFAAGVRGRLRDAAGLLGATGVCSVLALPLLRGYYQYGGGDALTHLGWTRDLLAGRLAVTELLYPGVHVTTVFVARILGVRLGRAQMVVVVAFAVAFVAFAALAVGVLGPRPWAAPVGLFAGLCLVPIDHVSVHPVVHPITQSIMLVPLAIYLVLRYVVASGAEGAGGRSTGVVLSLVSVALVLLHPQGAANVLAAFLAVLGWQLVARWRGVGGRVRRHGLLLWPTVVAAVTFLVWAPRHERVGGTIRAVLAGLFAGGGAPGDEIAQRSASLAELGSGPLVLFAKLYLVATVFCLLAAVLAAAWYRGHLAAERSALTSYVIAVGIPFGVAFALFFLASTTTQHFRYLGFVLVPATLLGAVALAEGVDRLPLPGWTALVRGDRDRRGPERLTDGGSARGTLSLAVGLLLVLGLAVATMHASPVVQQPTPDVTKHHLAGAETTFAVADPAVAFAGVRTGPGRVADGVLGTVGSRATNLTVHGPETAIRPAVFDRNLTSHYESDRYVPVTRADYRREVGLYEGFRYSERGFRRLRTARGVDRVYANGEYRLYLLHGSERA